MKKLKMIVKIGLVLAVLLITAPVTVIQAAIADPTALGITWAGVYRNYLEENDQLYLFTYEIQYGTNPTEGNAEELFLFRVMDGTDTLGTTRPYAYYDRGYDYGVGAIYFTSTEVTDLSMGWGGATGYSLKLQGDPLQDWTSSPPPNTVLSGFSLWYDGGDIASTQTTLASRIRVLAQEAENAWDPDTIDIIELVAGENKLTTAGETYFTVAVPYLRAGCPELFATAVTTPDYDDDLVIQDYYNLGEDDTEDIYGVNWAAQTFTPTQSYDISGMWLKLLKVGSPGTITISVRATTASLPSGADLATGTMVSTNVTTNTDGDWYELSYTTNLSLTAGVMYSVVVKATAGDASNYVSWLVDTAGGYDAGATASSTNSGVAWATNATDDAMFIVAAFGAQTQSFVLQREGFLLGTPLDFTDLAAEWGVSRMLIGGILWLILSMTVAYLISRKANSYKAVLPVIAILSPFGGYYGFMNFYIALLLAGMLGLAAIAVFFYNRAP